MSPLPATPAVTPAVTLAARPVELHDWLNRSIYHPLSGRLALRLSRTPVTPNMVSVAGAFLVVVAGIVYVQPGWPLPALAGLFLHMAWHVVDGADGDLARITRRSGAFGELVDGICDYAGHTVLYLILAAHLQAQFGPLAWVMAIAAGGSRIVQATFYETCRRRYQYWAYGVGWLGHRDGAVPKTGDGRWTIGLIARPYLALGRALNRRARQVDEAMAALADRGVPHARIQQIVRERCALALPASGLLGANGRTLALGLAMLAGSAAWFFLYEAVVLNAVLAVAILKGDAHLDELARRIVAEAEPSTSR